MKGNVGACELVPGFPAARDAAIGPFSSGPIHWMSPELQDWGCKEATRQADRTLSEGTKGKWLLLSTSPIHQEAHPQTAGNLLSCSVYLVTQSCLTLCNTMDCSLPGSSVHGIIQARILEWVAMPSSKQSSQPRDQTQVSHIAGGFFTL